MRERQTEEMMNQLIISLTRRDSRRPMIAADTDPTPLEIQRWEDDGAP
jgi:hypothetical protein